MKTVRPDITGPLPRPDLLSVLAYVNRGDRSRKSVDGSFAAEVHLDLLAAAAGMQ